MSVSTSQAAPLVAVKQPPSNPEPVSAQSTEVIPSPAAQSASVSKPAVAPVVFVGRVSSAPTVLLLGASQVITKTLPPSTGVSETVAATQLVLKPAASPGLMPQDVPSLDSSNVDGVDTLQEKVEVFVLSVLKPQFHEKFKTQ